MVCKLRTILK